jgi:hypothetical protein
LWHNPYNKSLYAETDIESGDVLMEIPPELIIHLEQILDDDPLLTKMNDEGRLTNLLSSPWRSVFFAIWLHKIKGTKHEWLLDLMEPDISTTPRFYNEENKNKIKNTTLEKLIEINDYEAKRDHLVLKEMCEPFKDAEITPEMLMVTKYHARRTCFPILDKDNQLTVAFVPLTFLVAMTSDEEQINVKWDLKAEGPVRLIAKRPISFGETIL